MRKTQSAKHVALYPLPHALCVWRYALSGETADGKVCNHKRSALSYQRSALGCGLTAVFKFLGYPLEFIGSN